MFRRLSIALALSALLVVSAAAQEVPRPAKDLELLMPKGGKLNLKQYRGKIIVFAGLLTT